MPSPTERGPMEAFLWVHRNRERLERWARRVQAEVDRRIAVHPDLAELDDALDDIWKGLKRS